jgi:hypothetical protein
MRLVVSKGSPFSIFRLGDDNFAAHYLNCAAALVD